MQAGDKWGAREAGPVVRPYAVTGGRTEPADGEVLDLIAIVVASGKADPDGDPNELGPEHRRIAGLCREPTTVADLAAETTLPLGVVRVLLADLILQGRITVLPHQPADEQPRVELLREVLHGLRAL
jgi:hypothetical protein